MKERGSILSERVSVPSAEFIRSVGYWQNEALRRPISITHHGRERLVLATPDQFDAASNVEGTVKLTRLLADVAAVLENLEDGFLAFDPDLRVTRSNRAAEFFIGRDRDSLHGAALADIMPRPVDLMLAERLQRVMRTRKPETFPAAAGDRHVSAHVFPLSEGAAVLLRNDTEQHDQRVQIGVGNALCAATNSHPNTAGIKLDASGRVTGVHDSFCAWSGLRAEGIVGRRFVDFLAAPHRGEIEDAVEAAALGAVPAPIDLCFVGNGGQEVRGLLTLAPILTDSIAHGVMAVLVRSDVAVQRAA